MTSRYWRMQDAAFVNVLFYTYIYIYCIQLMDDFRVDSLDYCLRSCRDRTGGIRNTFAYKLYNILMEPCKTSIFDVIKDALFVVHSLHDLLRNTTAFIF